MILLLVQFFVVVVAELFALLLSSGKYDYAESLSDAKGNKTSTLLPFFSSIGMMNSIKEPSSTLD